MRVRWATATAAAMLVAISGGVSSASSQQQPPPAPSLGAPPPLPLLRGAAQERTPAQDCDEDVFCRLDAIDARLARIERNLARGGGANGISIAVNQYCRRNECGLVAAQACRDAGFVRGASDEMDNSTTNPLIVRAVCFD